MEGLLDRASPRRGSLTSLHRYSSGSFSHNPRLGSPSNTSQVSNGSLYTLCKDLDKFTRYFIVKAVQVIVQSRVGGGHKFKTDCKPNGNDWFNINISDIVEVSDATKAVLDAEGVSVKSNWRVCCEISLKTNDGSRVVLEHWIISNKSYLNSNQKINSGQASPKGFMANRSLNTHLTSSNISNGSGGGSSPQNVSNSPGRDRTATFSNSSRTRLNSIDDCASEDNYVPKKLPMGANNLDIKPSTSCYSLSSAPQNHQQTEGNILVNTSPSTNSLNTNATASDATTTTGAAYTTKSTHDHHQPHHPTGTTNTNQSASPHQNQPHQSSASTTATTNKTSATSSIYTIYNRMSLLLKTLLTTTHVVPAYRLASRTSQTGSCVICYKVYMLPRQSLLSRGSIEDINSNLNHSESPNKRSLTSTSSLGSIDIRDFVSPDELERFCPILKLGSIKTDVSEIDVAVCYRTDLRNSTYMLKNPKASCEKYNRILDEDCLTAAKQLLAGNECLRDRKQNGRDHDFRNRSQNSLNNGTRAERKALDLLDQPLRPPFANAETSTAITCARRDSDSDQINRDSTASTKSGELIESAFEGLLRKESTPSEEDLTNIASEAIKIPASNSPSNQLRSASNNSSPSGKTNGDNKSAHAHSEPIQVPNQSSRNQSDQHSSNLTPGSTPKSLTDSYVFVDLNPPFASDEQNDINSFFHGPSPSFKGSSSIRDVDELTNQLASIEANASQIDEFVDSICVSEDDEEEK